MTISQLNTEIWRSMSAIADDENLMKRAAKYLRHLASEKQSDSTVKSFLHVSTRPSSK